MCQSDVAEYTTGKREYLGFVLQTADGGREDKAVIVTLEFRAVFMAFLVNRFMMVIFTVILVFGVLNCILGYRLLRFWMMGVLGIVLIVVTGRKK